MARVRYIHEEAESDVISKISVLIDMNIVIKVRWF